MNCRLRIGDLLYRSKGFVEHAAIYLGNNLVFHTSPTNGPEMLSLEDYSEGKIVKVIHTENSNIAVLKQRIQQIGLSTNRYNVVSDNCEHIASYLIHGRKLSPQLQATFCGIVVGLLLGQKMSKSGQFLLMLLGGLTGCYLSNATRKYDDQIKVLPTHLYVGNQQVLSVN